MNKIFLEGLEKKLSGIANLRSIYLNCLPEQSAQKLDVNDLNDPDIVKNNKFSSEFFEQLLSKPKFKLELTLDSPEDLKITGEENLEQKEKIKTNNDIKKRYTKLRKRLNNILSTEEDNISEYGIGVFGFGYPILVKKRESDNKWIKAPFIVWSLQIEASKSKKNTWIIKREEDSPIYLNQPLIASLEQEKIKFNPISEDILDDGIVGKDELKGLIKEISQTLDLKNDFSFKIEKVPTKKQVEKLNQIIEGGVFGVYKQLKSNIIKDIKEIKKNHEQLTTDNDSNLNTKSRPYSSVDTDPSQQKVINNLNKKVNTIIHGPPGTGKSQTLTGIITNSLLNDKKILVVCEKKVALEVLNTNLEEQELDRFSVIIENIKLDRQRTVKKARDIVGDYSDTSRDDNGQFEKWTKIYEKKITEENVKRKNVNEEILGGNTWKKVVTKFLKSNKIFLKPDKENLKNKLKNSLTDDSFEYSLEEYESLEQLIKDAKSEFFSSNDCFNCFEKNYFSDPFISHKEEHLKETLERIANEIKETEARVKEHKDKTSQKIQKIFTEKLNQIKELDSLKKKNAFDTYFDKRVYLTFGSIFGKKAKEIKFSKEEFIKKYFNLKDCHIDLFHFKFLKKKKSIFENFNTNIKEYKKKLKHHLKLLKDRDYFHKDFNRENNLIKEFQEKEINLYKKLSSLHSKEIFNEDYIDKNLSPSRLRYDFHSYKKNFSELKIEFEKLVEEGNFEKFYEWKFFLYRERKDSQKILSLLNVLIKEFKKDDWLQIFSSYYFNNVLKRKESDVRPLVTDDRSLKEIKKIKKEITEVHVKEKIKAIWGDKWKNHQDKNLKRIFNLKASPGKKRNSLKNIVNKNFDLFTDFFPVLFLTPEVACTILPLKNLFDLVVFDEASQLRIEDTYPAYIRGKYKIISGDDQQMPPSSYFGKEVELDENREDTEEAEEATESANEKSLLSFVLESGLVKEREEKFLEYHYRSEHPALIEFSNKAFYKSKLISTTPAKDKDTPFKFVEVNGLYQNRMNEEEAQEVINEIKEILKNSDDENVPSIGVATFNVSQRDLIKERIREESLSDTDSLMKLDKSKYFVKNLENIQGDERDIIILSTTFGKNPEGKFKQNFGGISNKENGYRLLNVLITRAKRKVILLNSIPEEYYGKYQENLENLGETNGRALLYAYIAYVKAISKNNIEEADIILEKISPSKPKESFNNGAELTESPFEEAVLEYLIDGGIARDKIELQYPVGGFRIDMVIKDKKGNPKVAIECDGAAYHSGELAVQEDLYRQTIIEEKTDLIFKRIYSTNWWHNTRRESKKLIEFINKKCC